MDYQLNRRKKNITVFITKCISVDLALNVVLAKKCGKGKVFQEIEMYVFFFISK